MHMRALRLRVIHFLMEITLKSLSVQEFPVTSVLPKKIEHLFTLSNRQNSQLFILLKDPGRICQPVLRLAMIF